MNGQIYGITWIILRYLSDEESIITFIDELEKIFHLFSNNMT